MYGTQTNNALCVWTLVLNLRPPPSQCFGKKYFSNVPRFCAHGTRNHDLLVERIKGRSHRSKLQSTMAKLQATSVELQSLKEEPTRGEYILKHIVQFPTTKRDQAKHLKHNTSQPIPSSQVPRINSHRGEAHKEAQKG